MSFRMIRALLVLVLALPLPASADAPARLMCGPLAVLATGQSPAQHVRVMMGAAVLVSATGVMDVQCASGLRGPSPALLIGTFTPQGDLVDVYETSPFRRVLRYNNGIVAGVTLHPAARGTMALVLNDGHFAHYGGLSQADSPAEIPLVACGRGGAWVDCTREFPDVIKSCLALYVDMLDYAGHSPEDDATAQGGALGTYACQLLRGQDSVSDVEHAIVVQSGNTAAARRIAAWVGAHAADVRQWLAGRGTRLLSP